MLLLHLLVAWAQGLQLCCSSCSPSLPHMTRVRGLKLPSTPVRAQLSKDLKEWCQYRGHKLPESQSHDSQSTVPARDSQLPYGLVDDGEDRQREPLLSPSPPSAPDLNNMGTWAEDWARELEEEAKAAHALRPGRMSSNIGRAPMPEIPAWAFQWASELDVALRPQSKRNLCTPSRSRSPAPSRASALTNKPRPTLAPHLLHKGALLPSSGSCSRGSNDEDMRALVSLGGELAARSRCIESSQDEFQRHVSDGQPMRNIEDLAMFLAGVKLYGHPHSSKLIMSRGKPCGICVQPSFGGSLSVYVKTGKINIQGPLHARSTLLSMVQSVSQKNRPAGVQDGLPDPARIFAKLSSVPR